MLMLPSTIGIFAFIPLGGRMSQRRGSRTPVLVGLVVMAAGLVVVGQLSVDSTLVVLGAGLVIVGLGLGLLSTPVSNTAVGEAPPELAGTAAGVFKMSSMVGGALGVAVLAAIARSATQGDVDVAAKAAGMSGDEIDQAHRALVQSTSFTDAIAKLPADLAQKVTDAAIRAFTDGVAQSLGDHRRPGDRRHGRGRLPLAGPRARGPERTHRSIRHDRLRVRRLLRSCHVHR